LYLACERSSGSYGRSRGKRGYLFVRGGGGGIVFAGERGGVFKWSS
jgi:hypothetical protein